MEKKMENEMEAMVILGLCEGYIRYDQCLAGVALVVGIPGVQGLGFRA